MTEHKKNTNGGPYYYLMLFPMEGLVASQADPFDFGVYMATGAKRGTAERLIFVEITGDISDHFDVAYAQKKCVIRPDGMRKNSVYLSIYRTLEHVPASVMGKMYLITPDGRSLSLDPAPLPEKSKTKPFHIYQELTPMRPVVVSSLDPREFSAYMTDPSRTHAWVPRIAFADLKVVDLDNLDNAGNIGDLYFQNVAHLRRCIQSVTTNPDKFTKTLDRSRLESFTYQLIDSGIYVGDKEEMVFYAMPSIEELRRENYYWAKSAMII